LGRVIRVVIEETNRKQKQELIAIVEIPIIADFHLLDLDIKVSLFYFWEQLLHMED
jgi:hypothetical protein